MIHVAVFDTKSYDRPGFESFNGKDLSFKFFESRLTEDTAVLTKGFDAVCVFVNDDVSARVIDMLVDNGVKLIALRCAGFNNVDLKHALGKIRVVRVPAYSPYAVAEHTMALLLTSLRRIHKAFIRTRDFNFTLDGLTGFDLHGKTVGVIGTGKIGRIFIGICRGFGMNVIAYDPYPFPDADFPYVPLEDIFAKSDIISLHCPLTADTEHIINEKSIAAMKKGVFILNTSRGGLIDSEALLEGIKTRQVGAACLDVYEEESDFFFQDYSGHIMSDDVLARLISMPNVIVTSHQAFLTSDALANIAQTTAENIRTFFEKGEAQNEVCYLCQ
ncbi:MAG: 2-hydroxyacid dehydrogenase [Clostridia bacterium]|nr:2-hydroxyacid dehydrogenase [Clostridia bacterium]